MLQCLYRVTMQLFIILLDKDIGVGRRFKPLLMRNAKNASLIVRCESVMFCIVSHERKLKFKKSTEACCH